MNSAVMPAGCFGTYKYSPATVFQLKDLVTGALGEWKSNIGYPQNVDLIKTWTGVTIDFNRDNTVLKDGDAIFTMRLKSRVVNPATKGQPVSEDPEDWEFAWVTYNAPE